MALRSGVYGQYYGSTFTESKPLTTAEMAVNARYIFSALKVQGWSVNAISAMLGNMEAESTMNPGRWQSDNVGATSNGYGLVQWTPSTNYTSWCSQMGYADPSEMDNNISRILYEVENGLQWIATSEHNMSFKEFTTSSKSVGELARAFLLCYERPADQSTSVQVYRASLANYWYKDLTGETPSTPVDPVIKKKSNFKFYLFNTQRRKTWIRQH